MKRTHYQPTYKKYYYNAEHHLLVDEDEIFDYCNVEFDYIGEFETRFDALEVAQDYE